MAMANMPRRRATKSTPQCSYARRMYSVSERVRKTWPAAFSVSASAAQS